MWLRLRNTARRGRSPVPARVRRIRSWRFCRAAPRLATDVIVLVPSLVPGLGGLLLAADLAGLAGLSADLLSGIADALALVRLGFSRRSYAGRHLADQLLVDPDDRQAGRVLELEADAVRRLDLDRVAVAKGALELLAHLLGAIADAGDLEALSITGRHAGDHVGDKRSGQAVELLVHLRFGRAPDDDPAVLLGDRDVRM